MTSIRIFLLLLLTTFTATAFSSSGSPSPVCPDLSGKWTCQTCHDDRGPFETGYSISQKTIDQFTDYEFPSYPEPVRYSAHAQKVLEFGAASTSCKNNKSLVIQERNGSKKTTQNMERVTAGHILIESTEEGVNQFGNSYTQIRLEVCSPAKPKFPGRSPLIAIAPTQQARGDECALLRDQARRLRETQSPTQN